MKTKPNYKTIGIIANTTKSNVNLVVSELIKKLQANNFDFLLSNFLLKQKELIAKGIKKGSFVSEDKLCKNSDLIISIGGDGTMLTTAYKAQFYDKPVLGINYGKLGFLSEANINQIDILINEIKSNSIKIEKRILITGEVIGHKVERLFAINDIVIDKGGWPKMIELELMVNGEYVTTFSADGVVVATPTGSTGYSLSIGGPIVNPMTDAITLSPISPHSLTVRPIVLPSNHEIFIKAISLHKEILVNCDGQRVFAVPPPLKIKISKSERSLKLVRTSLTSYFETLRNKLLWGVDLRKRSGNEGELK
ncbi:MAG: NAD(+)/NADH kinase [Ignavibacteriaceae bacterium]|nr:NAD(+)/NADH kinase [Ignavibacteriaceae bacterium]